jgi:hypothetical protein
MVSCHSELLTRCPGSLSVHKLEGLLSWSSKSCPDCFVAACAAASSSQEPRAWLECRRHDAVRLSPLLPLLLLLGVEALE